MGEMGGWLLNSLCAKTKLFRQTGAPSIDTAVGEVFCCHWIILLRHSRSILQIDSLEVAKGENSWKRYPRHMDRIRWTIGEGDAKIKFDSSPKLQSQSFLTVIRWRVPSCPGPTSSTRQPASQPSSYQLIDQLLGVLIKLWTYDDGGGGGVYCLYGRFLRMDGSSRHKKITKRRHCTMGQHCFVVFLGNKFVSK